MRDYRERRRNTRPISWTTIATVCGLGALAYYGLYRGAVLVARLVGWL